MSATAPDSLEDIVSHALPRRLSPKVREHLAEKTLVAVRVWQERTQGKEPSNSASAELMKVASKAILALEKARQQIGFSSSYQEAIDNLVWVSAVQDALQLGDAPPGNISEGMKKLAETQTALYFIEETERPRPTHIAKDLEFALALGLMRLQLWVDENKAHRGISRSPATDLAVFLADVLKSERVTDEEIENIFDSLRAVAWLPRLSLHAAKKDTQRGNERTALTLQENWQSPRTKRPKRTRRTN